MWRSTLSRDEAPVGTTTSPLCAAVPMTVENRRGQGHACCAQRGQVGFSEWLGGPQFALTSFLPVPIERSADGFTMGYRVGAKGPLVFAVIHNKRLLRLIQDLRQLTYHRVEDAEQG